MYKLNIYVMNLKSFKTQLNETNEKQTFPFAFKYDCIVLCETI